MASLHNNNNHKIVWKFTNTQHNETWINLFSNCDVKLDSDNSTYISHILQNKFTISSHKKFPFYNGINRTYFHFLLLFFMSCITHILCWKFVLLWDFLTSKRHGKFHIKIHIFRFVINNVKRKYGKVFYCGKLFFSWDCGINLEKVFEGFMGLFHIEENLEVNKPSMRWNFEPISYSKFPH
jgi:hypothetical protein